MMEAVWIALGGNVAFLAVVAFLGQKIVAHWLDKDLGRYKQQLSDAASREMEPLKQQLQITTNEHSILLGRLQDRRATVIGTLYADIATGARELGS